jgi:protoheme ferro-lyase
MIGVPGVVLVQLLLNNRSHLVGDGLITVTVECLEDIIDNPHLSSVILIATNHSLPQRTILFGDTSRTPNVNQVSSAWHMMKCSLLQTILRL